MPSFIKSFRTKVTLVVILAMFFAGALSNYLIFEYFLKSQLNQLRRSLMVLAQTVASQVEADKLLAIPLTKEGASTPQYEAVYKELSVIKESAPALAYVYVMKKSPEKDIYQFIIDLKPGPADGKKPTALPGDRYDGSMFPELAAAFNGPSADTGVVTDEWGVFLSAYAPIRDKNGSAVAVLGIDMTAGDVRILQKEVYKRFVFVLILGVLFSMVVGMVISGNVTGRIERVVDGVRRISKGDLQYRVSVGGSDEINELAKSFNDMAVSLDVSRERLLNYFYDVVQSFVRVMEARDPYTKGHSDRVAEYSEKIGRQIGLSEEKLELLREAALLHDIGKLGVHEAILNKNMKLTEEEQLMVQKHPSIGEEVLKPIAVDEEMLAVVREHHERYDGKGYPNKLKGDEIDPLAAIVAVADSYDAMTSHRPYRTDLTKKEAVAQLEENRGVQFDPKVVDAFLDVLKKER